MREQREEQVQFRISALPGTGRATVSPPWVYHQLNVGEGFKARHTKNTGVQESVAVLPMPGVTQDALEVCICTSQILQGLCILSPMCHLCGESGSITP